MRTHEIPLSVCIPDLLVIALHHLFRILQFKYRYLQANPVQISAKLLGILVLSMISFSKKDNYFLLTRDFLFSNDSSKTIFYSEYMLSLNIYQFIYDNCYLLQVKNSLKKSSNSRNFFRNI